MKRHTLSAKMVKALICAFMLLLVALLSSCALGPIHIPPTINDGVATTNKGCKIRYPSAKETMQSISWTGGCDANGFASGSGTLTSHYYAIGGTLMTEIEVTTMSDGLRNGLTQDSVLWVDQQGQNRAAGTRTYVNGQIEGEVDTVYYLNGRPKFRIAETIHDNVATNVYNIDLAQ